MMTTTAALRRLLMPAPPERDLAALLAPYRGSVRAAVRIPAQVRRYPTGR